MNFVEYQKLAVKTKSPTNDKILDLIHAGMGIFTEVGEIIDQYKKSIFYKRELDLVNIKEEIGDVLWYIALAYDSLGRQMVEPEKKYGDPEILFLLGKLGSYAGKCMTIPAVYRDDALDFGIDYELSMLLSMLNILANHIGTTLEDQAYNNVVKLAKRYPEGFTEFHANNRDTKNELSHI